MLSTPHIPDWIKTFRHNLYTNIYDLRPDETRLYGTESLYHDWGGQLLLLAQDFAPACLVKMRIKAGDPRPYHHTCWIKQAKMPGAQTNKRLFRFVDDIPCGKLYGSALANLLKNDPDPSGHLPIDAEVRCFVCRVLMFTVDHMPNLRAIGCLGEKAWGCAANVCGIKEKWREQWKGQPFVEVKGIRLFALRHPSRASNADMRICQKLLLDFFGGGSIQEAPAIAPER